MAGAGELVPVCTIPSLPVVSRPHLHHGPGPYRPGKLVSSALQQAACHAREKAVNMTSSICHVMLEGPRNSVIPFTNTLYQKLIITLINHEQTKSLSLLSSTAWNPTVAWARYDGPITSWIWKNKMKKEAVPGTHFYLLWEPSEPLHACANERTQTCTMRSRACGPFSCVFPLTVKISHISIFVEIRIHQQNQNSPLKKRNKIIMFIKWRHKANACLWRWKCDGFL